LPVKRRRVSNASPPRLRSNTTRHTTSPHPQFRLHPPHIQRNPSQLGTLRRDQRTTNHLHVPPGTPSGCRDFNHQCPTTEAASESSQLHRRRQTRARLRTVPTTATDRITTITATAEEAADQTTTTGDKTAPEDLAHRTTNSNSTRRRSKTARRNRIAHSPRPLTAPPQD
jgi:hypothetical protein